MSRLGKIPVVVPKEVKVAIEKTQVKFEGPKGKLSFDLPHYVEVIQKDGQLLIQRLSDTKQSKSNHGTTRSILLNMINGVAKGHRIDLEIQGVGFRAVVAGPKLTLNLGYSNPVEFPIPAGVKITAPKPTELVIEGIDNRLVGEVAANIRRIKPAEPYKGKGVRYLGEIVRRKQGKSVTK